MPHKRSPRTQDIQRVMEIVRQWGREGGKTRARRLSADERRESARKAALARWRKTPRKKS